MVFSIRKVYNKFKRKEKRRTNVEKRMISKKGCRIMMAAAAVLAVIAAFITYQVGAVYGTEPLPLDLAV